MNLAYLDQVSNLLENEIYVKILENIDELDLDGYSIGPYEKDEKIVLDKWQGDILIENGYAQEIDLLTENEIAKNFWEDHKQQKLAELSPSFYSNLHKTLIELSEKSMSNKKLYQLYSKTIRDSRTLLDYRTKKIVDLALSQKKAEIDFMQDEEKILYYSIFNIIEKWRSFLNKILLVESK